MRMSPEDTHACAQLPDEVMFSIVKSPVQNNAARLGVLKLPNRKTIQTPHYLALGSRGAVPHLTQDNVVKHTDIQGVYMALEDFIEKPPPHTPILQFTPPDASSRLRRFTACPDDQVLVLGARRTSPVQSPGASTNEALAVMTSVGFRKMPVNEFRLLTTELDPDIIVGLGDIPYGYRKVSHKKIDKITDRTTKWMQGHVETRNTEREGQNQTHQPLLYAPLLPLPIDAQRYYVEHLVEDMNGHIQGLAIYDTMTLENLPPELESLPRLALDEPKNPLALLHSISHGIDIATLPFLTTTTDGGIALDISFPVTEPTPPTPKPLGVNMWDTTHATDLSPLRKDCPCYACTNHHRAFLQHLLAAKEMLAWVLLQIHNHHIMDVFFAGVRQSIARGTFTQDIADFERVYESDLPETMGPGPRLRGYQFKSEGPNEPKRNTAPFKSFNDKAQKLAEAEAVPLPSPGVDADALESAGFAEKVT